MKRFINILTVGVCLALLLTGSAMLLPSPAGADNNARDYIPAPSGTFAELIYYQHVSAQNFYVRGSTSPAKGGTSDLGYTANTGIFRTIYYWDMPTPWGPMRICPQVLVPFGEASVNGGVSSTGLGGPILLSNFWFINNDATKTYFAFSPFFFLKAGQYDASKGSVNIGNNRWGFRQEINFTKGFEVIPGHFAYGEVTLGIDEFTNNTDFGSNHQTLSQRPIFNVEGHLSYDLTKVVFAAVDFYGHYGGTYEINPIGTTVLGSRVGALGQSAIGATLAYSFAPGFQIMAQYRGDVAVANGTQGNIFLLRFLWATDLNSLLGNPNAKPNQ